MADMTVAESLRELDARVHKALYPEDRIEKVESRFWGDDYKAIRVYEDGGMHWKIVPGYTRDILIWNAVCVERPSWVWTIQDPLPGDPNPRVRVTLTIGDTTYASRISTARARFLFAWALGMSECVLAWAKEMTK